MNEILHEAYRTLRGLGVVKSANQFSREMLGRSSRMYSWILSSEHPPDLGVMVGLYSRIDDLCTHAEKSGDTRRARLFSGLANRLWDSIKTQSLEKGPNRRRKSPADDAQTVG
ncbi:MAG: hypothetical protein WCO00_12610 [Rhodospirillaceae bacterium]